MRAEVSVCWKWTFLPSLRFDPLHPQHLKVAAVTDSSLLLVQGSNVSHHERGESLSMTSYFMSVCQMSKVQIRWRWQILSVSVFDVQTFPSWCYSTAASSPSPWQQVRFSKRRSPNKRTNCYVNKNRCIDATWQWDVSVAVEICQIEKMKMIWIPAYKRKLLMSEDMKWTRITHTQKADNCVMVLLSNNTIIYVFKTAKAEIVCPRIDYRLLQRSPCQSLQMNVCLWLPYKPPTCRVACTVSTCSSEQAQQTSTGHAELRWTHPGNPILTTVVCLSNDQCSYWTTQPLLISVSFSLISAPCFLCSIKRNTKGPLADFKAAIQLDALTERSRNSPLAHFPLLFLLSAPVAAR